MKKLIWTLIGIGLAATVVTLIVERKASSPPPTETTVQSPKYPPSAVISSNVSEASTPSAQLIEETPTSAEPTGLPAPAPTGLTASVVSPVAAPTFSEPVQTLVSPQSTFAQKQAAWKQIHDRGELGHAITELEQAVRVNAKIAEYSAVLGQAYLQKLQATPDVRDQNILAMKADQSFDSALTADPSNWDARYWRAYALSFWPAEFNKSQEVMQNLSTLIDQQEAQPPQPQFAQTYVLLGEQYQKAGYADMAQEMWRRGAAIFPGDQALRAKLTSAK